MVRRCAYDGDGGAPAARAFATSTACGRETALPARDYIYHIFFNHPPAWETALISVSICSPSQFAHLHGKPHRFLYRSIRLHNSLTCMVNRTDLCTSDHHLDITHGRKAVSPSRNPCDSDPFGVAIHNRCSPS